MFSDGSDLPLFSGTPQPGVDAPFTVTESEGKQAVMASCRTCLDTGRVGRKFCWCGTPTLKEW